MSLILKGIDLPEKNTRVICLFPNGAEELVVLDADSGATAGRPIQAIQIPKDHGRLIDGDLLKDTVRDSVPAYTIGVKIPTFGDTQIMSAIDVMPTILDEERE